MATQRIGYIRVSSLDQNHERQLDSIALDKVFTDKASAKDTNRPQLQAALNHIRSGDTLIVHSMDRLARNVEDMLRLVREMNDRGVSVQFVKENMTFTAGNDDPRSTLMFTMLSAFAQFERSLIKERQREGIALAKANLTETEQTLHVHFMFSRDQGEDVNFLREEGSLQVKQF